MFKVLFQFDFLCLASCCLVIKAYIQYVITICHVSGSPDLLLRRPGFNTRAVCVKFMVMAFDGVLSHFPSQYHSTSAPYLSSS